MSLSRIRAYGIAAVLVFSVFAHLSMAVGEDGSNTDMAIMPVSAIAPLPGESVLSETTCFGAGGNEDCCCCWEPWTLFPNDNCLGVKVGGWVELGTTTGADDAINPATGYGNMPVGFNYRREELQLHQLWMFMERETCTRGCGWDLGGRVDLMYGEDYIFTQAIGLETDQSGANRWNEGAGNSVGIGGNARSGLALPQFYADLAYNNLVFRLGHFFSDIGYERIPAPQNFFYSHSYQKLSLVRRTQFAEPISHTGGQFMWQVNDQLSVMYGVVNGWDVFDTYTDRVSHIAGVRWQSQCQRMSVAFHVITGDEAHRTAPATAAIAGIGNRTMYSLVFDYHFTKRLEYVLQHNCGWQDNGRVAAIVEDAEWYGICNYFFYRLNDCWKAGLRYEWFNDDDGTRIVNFGGHWHELTLGLNWTPRPNIRVRPELRYDWVCFHQTPVPPGPFDDFTKRDQFLAAMDVIVTF